MKNVKFWFIDEPFCEGGQFCSVIALTCELIVLCCRIVVECVESKYCLLFWELMDELLE